MSGVAWVNGPKLCSCPPGLGHSHEWGSSLAEIMGTELDGGRPVSAAIKRENSGTKKARRQEIGSRLAHAERRRNATVGSTI